MARFHCILLYNSVIELPGSNQTFGKNQGLFSNPRAHRAGKEEHLAKCVASEDLKKFKGKPKENSVNV